MDFLNHLAILKMGRRKIRTTSLSYSMHLDATRYRWAIHPTWQETGESRCETKTSKNGFGVGSAERQGPLECKKLEEFQQGELQRCVPTQRSDTETAGSTSQAGPRNEKRRLEGEKDLILVNGKIIKRKGYIPAVEASEVESKMLTVVDNWPETVVKILH